MQVEDMIVVSGFIYLLDCYETVNLITYCIVRCFILNMHIHLSIHVHCNMSCVIRIYFKRIFFHVGCGAQYCVAIPKDGWLPSWHGLNYKTE